MTNDHIAKLRALPTMSPQEARAAFEIDRDKFPRMATDMPDTIIIAMLACWPKIIDEICRLEAELHAADHVNLAAAIEENEALKQQVQDLTDQLGQLTMGQQRR